VDGAPIAGATHSSTIAGRAGEYACAVTAANHAGSATQTSAAHGVLSQAKISKAKITPGKHTAKFSFTGSTGTTGFQCALIKRRKNKHKKAKPHFASCKSPKAYKHLKTSKYTFEVRALSTAGTGPTVTKNFKIS
jgi:hypothetical protein